TAVLRRAVSRASSSCARNSERRSAHPRPAVASLAAPSTPRCRPAEPRPQALFPPAPRSGPQEGARASLLNRPTPAIVTATLTASSHRDYSSARRLWCLAVEHPFGHGRAPLLQCSSSQ